jgi:hypothetical protein
VLKPKKQIFSDHWDEFLNRFGSKVRPVVIKEVKNEKAAIRHVGRYTGRPPILVEKRHVKTGRKIVYY